MAPAPLGSVRWLLFGLPLTILLAASCSYDRPTEPRQVEKLDVRATSAGFLHDNFTGPNGTLLENHIPDGEGDPFRWIRGGQSTGHASATILNNGLVAGEYPDSPGYTYFADAGGDFNAVEADLEVTGPVTEDNEVTLYIQATPEAGYLGDGWVVRVIINGGTLFALYRGGCSEDVTAPPIDWSPGIHHARFEIVGGQVANFYLDSALVLTGDPTCGDLPPSGAVGISGIGPGQVRITSFTAGEGKQQSVNVVCLPNNPVRGDSIHCKTALAVPVPYRVTRRTAVGAGFQVDDLNSWTHQPGDTNTWEGIAVAPTDVTVEVQVGTGSTAQTLSNQTPASFGVQSRPWPTWQLATLFGPTHAVVAPKMVDFPVVNTDLGLFQPDYPSAVSLALSRPTGGPNSGLVYLRDPINVTGYIVYTHPALYPPNPSTPAGSKLWYKDQNGKGTGTPTPAYCSTSGQIATLAANVERHEGVTKDPARSHYGVANQQFALLQPQRIFEEMYGRESDVLFRAKVDTAFVIFNNTGAYAAAQQSFESRDTGPTLGSASCTFDFNPNDK